MISRKHWNHESYPQIRKWLLEECWLYAQTNPNYQNSRKRSRYWPRICNEHWLLKRFLKVQHSSCWKSVLVNSVLSSATFILPLLNGEQFQIFKLIASPITMQWIIRSRGFNQRRNIYWQFSFVFISFLFGVFHTIFFGIHRKNSDIVHLRRNLKFQNRWFARDACAIDNWTHVQCFRHGREKLHNIVATKLSEWNGSALKFSELALQFCQRHAVWTLNQKSFKNFFHILELFVHSILISALSVCSFCENLNYQHTTVTLFCCSNEWKWNEWMKIDN